MTIPEHIMTGVALLVRQQGHDVFTRQQVRDVLNVENQRWKDSYNPTFQGMRDDQPGGAPGISGQYKRVFHRVRGAADLLRQSDLLSAGDGQAAAAADARLDWMIR